MSFLKDAINHMRSFVFGLHGKACQCQCNICKENGGCKSPKNPIKSVTALLDSILCPKSDTSSFHALACLSGQCKRCGPDKLDFCAAEAAFISKKIVVKIFEDLEVGTARDGKKKKRKVLSHKEMSCQDLSVMFKDRLKKYIMHNFLYRWQAEQYKECIQSFPEDVVVSVDFAENYSFKEQNEIQSMHWYSRQVTIFVHITYFRVAGDIHKTIHFFISDDKQHDTHFVQHYFLKHAEWLKQFGLNIRRHWVWSDGAASQFKARRPFYFLARYSVLMGWKMSWNFFESGHGKGEHDGAGAVIKRSLTQYQLQPDCPKLDCATNVVALLRQTLSDGATATYASQARYVSRVFWEIELGDVKREKNWDVKAVKNTRSMHSVFAYSEHDTTALRTRSLSCFCSACKQEKWRRCVSKSHVPFWTYLILEPTEEGEDDDDEINEDAAYEGHYDTLSQAVIVGDNFAVIAPNDNEEKVDFYIVKCTAAIEEFHSDAEDDWGNIIGRGSYAVKGFYYCMINEKTYKLLDQKPEVFIYSHLVCAIKIPMIPHPCNSKLYTISLDVSESIYNNMPFEL